MDIENDPNCHMLSQPLTTEDGFLNEACWNELCEAIKNVPKTHERLANDPEWNTPRGTSYREITAGLAYWAIRQFNEDHNEWNEEQQTYIAVYAPAPPAHAPNLEKIIGYLTACIRPKFDKYGYAKLSLCDVSKMLHDILYEQNITLFNDWNKKEVLGPHWLDLDALLHNVCLSIRAERRDNDKFDKDFQEEWQKNYNGELPFKG